MLDGSVLPDDQWDAVSIQNIYHLSVDGVVAIRQGEELLKNHVRLLDEPVTCLARSPARLICRIDVRRIVEDDLPSMVALNQAQSV